MRLNDMKRFLTVALLTSAFAAGFAAPLAPPPGVASEDFSRAVDQMRNRQIVNRAVYDSVRPSTVQIMVKEKAASNEAELFLNPYGRRRPDRGQQQQATSLGSGFIIDSSGLIVTNRHVVRGAKEVDVKLSDGRLVRGTVKGYDDATDIALVQVQGLSNLQVARLGDSDAVRVGDIVFTVGNPFGLDGTLSTGVVSAVARSLDGTGMKFIQTDAAINPGNSGGPLINLDGEVIGINSMIFSTTGANIGIGFAIPMSEAKRIIQEIRTSGTVVRPFLGIMIEALTVEGKKKLGIEHGVMVAGVFRGSGADKAGIELEDIIEKVDGKWYDDPAILSAYVQSKKVGDRVPVDLIRKGQRITVMVTLGKMPENRPE